MNVEPTPEQRQQFEREFAGYFESLDDSPNGNIGDRTQNERTWVAARTYSEGAKVGRPNKDRCADEE